MANMSYCRFHNTLLALKDCSYYLDDELSVEETTARKRLVKLCRDIIEETED